MNKIEEIIKVLNEYNDYKKKALKGDRDSARKLYDYSSNELYNLFNNLDLLDDVIESYLGDMKNIIIAIEGEEKYNKLKELEDVSDDCFDNLYYNFVDNK